MNDTGKKLITFGNRQHLNNESPCEKLVTLVNTSHTRKNGPHFEKRSHVGNHGNTRKIRTLVKIRHKWKNTVHLEKWVTPENMLHKMSHNSTNSSLLLKGVTYGKKSTKKEWLTLGKSSHTCKNGSHLEKCGTLEKYGLPGKLDRT